MFESSLVPLKDVFKSLEGCQASQTIRGPWLEQETKMILAYRGIENHIPEEDFEALASIFQAAVNKAREYLEEAESSTPTAPAACIESDSPGTCSSPTLSLGAEGLEPLGNENLEGQREP